MTDPRRVSAVLARARMALYVVLFGMVGWGVWRYDVIRLPEAGCSPLTDFQPGARLVIDQHPGDIAQGDAVLFENPAGELLLGRIGQPPPSAPQAYWDAVEDGALWIVGENPDCPQADSRRHGPLARERVRGVIASILPW